MSEEKETPPETLSKSWVVVEKAEDATAAPALNSGVENIPATEKESNDSHVDSDTDSISIISESDGGSRNGKSDEEEVIEAKGAHGIVTSQQQIVSGVVSEIEMLTSDYLKEKWKVKQLSIALVVVISSVLLGYYVEMTCHAKSNYQFDIAMDDNFRTFTPVRRFDPYKKYGIKDAESKKEPAKVEKIRVRPVKTSSKLLEEPYYKNDKAEELNIKEIYLSEKEKFLIQKEHELVKREMEMRQAENAFYKKKMNEPRKRDEHDNNYKNNMRKESPLKQEKEKRRDDKCIKPGHCPREENNSEKDNHDRYADKKSRPKHEDDEKPEEDGVSGRWYMNLHQARNNLRNKMDYPFIKKMKNRALWYFRWMFARESNRSNKRKSKFEI